MLIKFYWLREQNELRKKPSTSELIDWIAVLQRSGMSADDIELHIPFLGALLKNEKDHEALDKYHGRGGRYPTEWKELGPSTTTRLGGRDEHRNARQHHRTARALQRTAADGRR